MGSATMRGRAALLTVLVVVAGCSGRDRANPFDPANPTTLGRPVGFEALAGNSTITLRWQGYEGTGLQGYRLERRVGGAGSYQVLVPLLAPETVGYSDFGLQNGLRHEYRLFYVFRAGPSATFASDFGTPGSLRPWVTDIGIAQLLQLTADGRHVLRRDLLFDSPVGVAVDPAQGVVWVSDSFDAELVRINPANGSRLTITGLSLPGAVAVDQLRHTAWVCDERLGAVLQFQLDGSPGAPSAVGPVDLPLSVAVDPVDGTVWVCDRNAAALRQFTPGGTQRFRRPLPRPSRVAVDSLTRDAWVTSFDTGTVMRVRFDGTVLDTVGGFQGPIGIAVDARRGRVWIADARAGAIVELQRDGSVERRMAGFSEVHEIAVDLETGNAWATVPGGRRVVVVEPSGAVIAQVTGLAQPYALAVDPGLSVGTEPQRIPHGSSTTLRTEDLSPAVKRMK